MTNYPVADFLIRIKNAYMAGKQNLEAPYSKELYNIGKILKEEGYISDISVSEKKDEGKVYGKELSVKLLYKMNFPSISEVKLISKPTIAVYAKREDLSRLTRKYGTSILTTNQGFMTARSALKKGVGGKVICHIA